MFIAEVFSRYKFWANADRLGPDIPLSSWRLHYPSLMRGLCESKFKHFGQGAQFRFGAYAIVCSRISIGDNVVIRPGSLLCADVRNGGAEIIIEDNVLLAPGVHIHTQNHRYADKNPIIEQGHAPSKPVIIRKGSWIGTNSVILPGVEIGENAVVGAGSIVTHSIPPRVIAAGNPARVLKAI